MGRDAPAMGICKSSVAAVWLAVLALVASLGLSGCGDDIAIEGIGVADADDDGDLGALDSPGADDTQSDSAVGDVPDDARLDVADVPVPDDVTTLLDVADAADALLCADGFLPVDGAATDDAALCVPVPPPCTPTPEVCNGLDDDCNGLIDDGTCSDGNPCTFGDVCNGAACLPGPVTDCTDGNVCTIDGCDTVSGCSHLVFIGPCDDKSACTDGDMCVVQGSGDLTPTVACVGAVKSCHDENSCTIDSCDTVKGCIHLTAPVNSTCDDQNACTVGDVCDHDGNCIGAPLSCDDANPCTVDLCDVKGACTFASGNGLPCQDGDLCTVGDACVLGVCTAGTLQLCSDDNPCTSDSCGSATGTCVFLANTLNCDDQNACTVGDVCQSGNCVPGTLTVCDDKAYCTDDACDTTTGACVFVAAHDGLGCEDGNACTTGDICVSGQCTSGQPPKCDDGNICTADICVAATGLCDFSPLAGTACDDNEACTSGDACQGGQCVAGKAVCECKKLSDCAVKEDGDACNGTLWCNLSDHTCQLDPATVVTCDASKNGVCLQYVCNKLTGQCDAQNLNEGGKCDADSSACSTGDFCQAGVCITGSIPGCDDSNNCTNDSCDPVIGCVFAPNAAPCNDGEPCTLDDHCAGGKCAAGQVKNCDDGSDCTADTCKGGVCLSTALNGTACSDGSLCTLNDKCVFGGCVPGAPQVCPDGATCTVPTCDGTTGKCGTKTAFDGETCQDGSDCTVGDYCYSGKCQSGSINCASADPCLSGACNFGTGKCLFTSGVDGVACSDGNPCTVTDTCKSGKCLAGATKICEAGQTCAQPICDLTTGACVANANGIPCDDNNACTANDHCQDGACVFGTVQTCDDGKPCTADACDPVTAACSHSNISGPCDDGSVCTQTDTCTGGNCVGATSLNCDDKVVCTVDSCDPKLACVHSNKANGTTCDDKNDCTVNDICTAGVCQGTGQICGDGNPCTEDKCSLLTGCSFVPKSDCDDGNACTIGDHCVSNKCVSSTVVICNDGNPCTNDVCDASGGCTFVASSGAACNDKNACTDKDTCAVGQCNGVASNCDDKNDCTVDQCDPSTGCTHTPTTAVACSDGNACTLKDVCLNGACVSGDALNCADGNNCTDDACVPATGCVNTAVEGTCNDGNFCTGPDQCIGGVCKGTTTLSCDDGLSCTTDVCVPSDGCLNYPVSGSAACDDGNPCTNGDVCKSGLCSGVAVINCNDGNYCTLDSCSLASGCSHSILTGSVCDDGNLCTVGDVCTAAGTCKPGVASGCDDSNPCTVDTCTGSNGCNHVPGSTGQSTSLSIPGDTQVTVTLGDGSMQPAVATWDQYSGWTHAVSQAVWIWSTYLMATPQAQTQVAFTRTFTVPAGAATVIGQLQIASDGAFVCLLNGVLVGVNTAEQNWLAPISQPLTGKLKVGSNTLVCTLVNPGELGTTAYTNPAGLLFRVDATMYDAAGALPCTDGNACTAGDWCNGGTCQPGGIVSCDDENGCTADACDAKLGCTHTASGVLSCNDGNPCTVVDACVGTVCTGGSPTNCNDFNACTGDSCDAKMGCVHATLNNAVCEDGNPCTINDTCNGSSCKAGTANPCDDGNVCSVDACTTLAGCYHTQAIGATNCNDNDPCTSNDTCTGITCVGTTLASCDDGNVCTNDSCLTGSGCAHTSNTLTCNDANICTVSDTCSGGKCVGAAKNCSDSNVCTLDACDSASGYCLFTPMSSGVCQDGNACTLNDFCTSGLCTPGGLRDCNDNDACTVDGCIPGSGDCLHTIATSGTFCDDGNACTVNDACDSGGCHGTAKNCDDGNPCTSDSCANGLCLTLAVPDGTVCPTGTCQAGVCK
jgi:hypothetical protein